MSTVQHSWYHSNNIVCVFIFVVTVAVLSPTNLLCTPTVHSTQIHNTCPSAHATDITTLGGFHDTYAGQHSHKLQIDEKNSKNCAQKHMNAQVCAVRWAHRRHRNAQPMGTDSSTFRPSTGDVTLPESGSWCISHVVAPCSRRIQHKAGTRGAKVDLLALPPRQAHYGLKC